MHSLSRSKVCTGVIVLAAAIGMLFPGLASADSGYATWYGPGFQGNTMYDGQPYDMYDPTTTAANIFPLGTWIKVTNPANGRSVVVQVRDRGAFTHTLDLSYAAFKAIANPALMGIPISYQVVTGASGSPVPTRAAPASRGGRPAPAATYVVQPGDTLDGIASQVGIAASSLAAWNNLTDPDQITLGQVLRLAAPAAPAAKPAPPPSGTYVVQSGDTLSSIAVQFGLTTDQLASANGLSDPNSIVIGQKLSVPGKSASQPQRTYTVQAGDSLSSIADSFGVDLDHLIAVNQVSDPALIQPGTVLSIPSQ